MQEKEVKAVGRRGIRQLGNSTRFLIRFFCSKLFFPKAQSPTATPLAAPFVSLPPRPPISVSLDCGLHICLAPPTPASCLPLPHLQPLVSLHTPHLQPPQWQSNSTAPMWPSTTRRTTSGSSYTERCTT